MSESEICGISLRWDDYVWLGPCPKPLFKNIPSASVEVHVETEDEGQVEPHELQAKKLQSLFSDSTNHEICIVKAIFAYYNEMRPKYEAAGADWVKDMPVVKSADGVVKMIRLNYLVLAWPNEQNEVRMGFAFDCDWEREHGMGVQIEGLEVKKIGGVDCLY